MTKKKTLLLGENFGTASAKLKKQIMFSLVQRLDLDTCYRCNEKITTVSEFSVEHIESWQFANDPVRAFYDLENIAFSHLKCNCGAGARPHQKYATRKEYRDATWARYYQRNREDILRRKRERYKNKKIS